MFIIGTVLTCGCFGCCCCCFFCCNCCCGFCCGKYKNEDDDFYFMDVEQGGNTANPVTTQPEPNITESPTPIVLGPAPTSQETTYGSTSQV